MITQSPKVSTKRETSTQIRAPAGTSPQTLPKTYGTSSTYETPGIGNEKASSTTPSAAETRDGATNSSSRFAERSTGHCDDDGQAAPSRTDSQTGTMLECPASIR